jgi:hypothetical protein
MLIYEMSYRNEAMIRKWEGNGCNKDDGCCDL